jgi:hypothetical protein
VVSKTITVPFEDFPTLTQVPLVDRTFVSNIARFMLSTKIETSIKVKDWMVITNKDHYLLKVEYPEYTPFKRDEFSTIECAAGGRLEDLWVEPHNDKTIFAAKIWRSDSYWIIDTKHMVIMNTKIIGSTENMNTKIVGPTENTTNKRMRSE